MTFDYEQSVWGQGSADLKWSFPSAFRLKQVLASLKNLPSGSRVLEVGCGAGQFIRAVKKIRPELECYGCDISRKAIEHAWAERDEVLYKINEEKELPYEAGYFDAVLVLDVLEHAAGPAELLQEINRTLKTGGIFHSFVPCEGDWLSLWHLLDKLHLKKGITKDFAGHVNYFSRRALAGLYAACGCEIRKKRYSEHLLGQILGVFSFYLMRRKSKKTGSGQLNNEQYFSSFGKNPVLRVIKKFVNAVIYMESLVFSVIPSPNTHWTMVKKQV
jgi:ubiquinone/menaquinone biosynthesis C-methylase UbiE